MRNDKTYALKLRLKGNSYTEISKLLGIPKSTLSGWFHNYPIVITDAKKATWAQKMRLANIAKWEAWRETFRIEARKEFKTFVKDPLFVAGINLYWGEGDHNLKNGKVKLINTDPKMIAIFAQFLRICLKVPEDKIRCWLILYKDLSDQECKSFWSNVSRVQLDKFGKTQYIQGRHPTRLTPNGMCTIEVYSQGLKEKIFVWTEMFYSKYAGIV